MILLLRDQKVRVQSEKISRNIQGKNRFNFGNSKLALAYPSFLIILSRVLEPMFKAIEAVLRK